MRLSKTFSTISKKELTIHTIVWAVGLILINIPSWEVTMGLFHSDDHSLIIPSIYGLILNAVLFYYISFEISRRNFSDISLSLKRSVSVFLKVSLLESSMDCIYYTFHYWTINKKVIVEIIWGQILMNFIFFTLPAVMYGLVRAWKKSDLGVEEESKIMIKDGAQIFYLNPNKLTHIESDGNYCIFHFEKKHLVRKSLKEAEEELPDFFQRCHKSFIINTHLIERHAYSEVVVAGFIIPIGRKYRNRLRSYLDEK